MPRPVLQVIASPSLQPMDLTTLRAVLWDLRPKLVPSRFEKAQQPDPATIQLGCRSLKGMVWLELSWQAEAPRLVEVNPPRAAAAAAPSPNSCNTASASWLWWSSTRVVLNGWWNSGLPNALGNRSSGYSCWS